MDGRYIFQLLLVFILLNNAFVSATFSEQDFTTPGSIETQEIVEGSGDEVDKEVEADTDKPVIKQLDDLENFMSNNIDTGDSDSDSINQNSENDIFKSKSNDSPKLKFVIPTDPYFMTQKLIPRNSRMVNVIEETPNDDSENKQVNDTSFSNDRDSKHSTTTPEYESSIFSEDSTIIETDDEGSGSDDMIMLSTTTETSITTTEMPEDIEETTTEEPSVFSTAPPNLVQQHSQHVSANPIPQETAQSLVASSESKRLASKNRGKVFQSKMYNIIFATSILSVVALFAILGLTYMFKSQKQTGTLDIEMQEQCCGKDSSENESTKDETKERLLNPPDANCTKPIDDIL